MKKYFIVTDIHGFYNEMVTALAEAGYDRDNPEHIFVSLGDLLDRGNQPLECLEFVNSIPKDRKILIRGNHEDLLETAIWRKSFFWNDISNGTAGTVRELYRSTHNMTLDEVKKVRSDIALEWLENYAPYKQYIDSTQYYAIRGDNIFLHGWVPFKVSNGEQFEYLSPNDWKEAAWDNGMLAYRAYGPIHKTENNKDGIYTVFCGHWHVSWYRRNAYTPDIPSDELWSQMSDKERKDWFRPVIEPGLVALDACTAFSGIVNCYVLEIE